MRISDWSSDYQHDSIDYHFDMFRGCMRAADLDIHELLHFFPEGGLITFAGERAELDQKAAGLLTLAA